MEREHTETSLNRFFRSSFPDFERSAFRTDSWRFGVAKAAKELKPVHETTLHALAAAAKLDDTHGITLLPERDDGPERQRSYRGVYQEARRIAAALSARGLAPGERVLLVLPTSIEYVSAFFGAQLLGAIPVPAYPPFGLRVEAGLARLAHIANHAEARVCITSKLVRPIMGELALRAPSVQEIVDVEELVKGEPPKGKRYHPRGEDPAFIQYTSGSTGNPKGVLLSHENLVANIHAIGQAMQIGRHDVVVSWLPLYHDMGLIGTLLFSVYWRIPLVLMSPTAFLGKPLRWLRAIAKHKGTLSPAPNFAYDLCVRRIKPSERAGLDLSSWRLAMNGAEPVNLRTLTEFEAIYREYGFKREALLPVYGLAESSLAVTFNRPGSPVRHEVVNRAELGNGHAVLASGKGTTSVVSVGTAVPGHEVLVVDEHGAKLPEREVGHIVVAGRSIMREYFRNPEATNAVLRNGWLWTGDLGYFSDGHLYVTGRAKDIIILRGKNHYAEDLERCVEGVEGVRPGGAVAFGIYDEEQATDQVVIVCETKLTDGKARDALAQQVSAQVAEVCEVRVENVMLVAAGAVPRTSSGKKQRSLCRDLYLKDGLGPTGPSKLRMAYVFVRSSAGLLLLKAKRALRGG
jgi:acyl-CoA synthetase (AMP-forming)/AMP-acid ligase II